MTRLDVRRDCELCYVTDSADVVVALVQWRRPSEHGGIRFESIARCKDRVGCQIRVEEAGLRSDPPVLDAWPVGRPDAVELARRPSPAAQPEPSPDVFPSRLESAYASRPPAAATDPPDLPLWEPDDDQEEEGDER